MVRVELSAAQLAIQANLVCSPDYGYPGTDLSISGGTGTATSLTALSQVSMSILNTRFNRCEAFDVTRLQLTWIRGLPRLRQSKLNRNDA